jgi:lysophospholipase L1-like esterase
MNMRRKTKSLLFVFLTVFLFFVFMEITLRVLGFGYNIVFRPPSLPEKTVFDNSFRIFCVGESTTWGIGTKNPSIDGYPKQLEKLLNDNFPEKRFICFWDQAIGQNTSEILLKFPEYIKKYNPHLIILMVGINNWWNLDKSNKLIFNNSNAVAKLGLKLTMVLERLRIWKLIKLASLRLGFYPEKWNYFLFEDIYAKANQIDRDYKSTWIAARELLEYDVQEMIRICKANKIKVIICNYPRGAFFPVSKPGFVPLDHVYGEFAKKFEISFVDNYSLFNSLTNLKEYMSDPECHPNKKGYSLVAKNIFDCILANKLFE